VAGNDPIGRLRAAPGEQGASSDFDLNPDLKPKGRTLRPAAVLMAFRTDAQEPQLILTKRASGLKHHPGQIAFPGGKVDATDTGATDAALREAQEEIGLARGNVEVLGALPPHETVTGFRVSPILGLVHAAFEPVAEVGEVEEVFSVPFSHIADPGKYIVESRYFRGVKRQFFVVPYGPHYIWGATARMLYSLAKRLR